MERNPGVDWKAVDDVVYGCANQAGEDNRNVGRMAVLLAGLAGRRAGHDRQPPVRIEHGRDRDRGAGDHGRRDVARGRRRRREHVARALRRSRRPTPPSRAAAKIEDTTIGWRFVNPLTKAKYGIDSHAGDRRERRRGVSRRAARTRMRSRCAASSARSPRWPPAASPRRSLPVTVPAKKGDPVVVSRDEHPRETTLEALAKLKGVVRPDGTVTAGNASGVNDGACAAIARLGRRGETPRTHATRAHRRGGGCRRRAAHHGLRTVTRDAQGPGAREPHACATWT